MEETTIIVEQTEETDSTAETAPEATHVVAEQRTFTQEEVNALLAKETSKIRRKYKKQKATPTVEANPEEDSATVQALERILGRLEQLETDSAEKSREVAFQAVINGRDVDADVKQLLQKTFDPEHPELTKSMLDKFAPVTTNATGYQSPGAPAQSKDIARGPNPMAWSKDDIEVLKREGRFLESLEQWRESLPGGGNGLMATKLRKKKRG